MSSNAKSTRDRTPKSSIVLNNVLAIVFRPTSTAVQLDEIDNTAAKQAPHTMSGLALFDAFKEANQSTMLTRLNESLDEIRLKGWIFPFTLLVKGPHEDVEAIKEAWRRHYLRSPECFVIRDIGAVSSVGMEVIQQAPFLPLTKSLVETIAALNGNNMAATQQSIAEHLAKTYQYVHVPKVNVIHDCLGILIKERKIYHTGSGYFVSARSPSEVSADTSKENGDANGPVEPSSKGKSAKTANGKRKHKAKNKEIGKDKENGKAKSSKKEEISETKSRDEKVAKETVEGQKTSDAQVGKAEKDEPLKSPSETGSISSGDSASKKTKKQKKGVFNQISCFIKGKTFSMAEIPDGVQNENTQTSASSTCQPTNDSAFQRSAPLAVPEVESPTLLRTERSVRFRNNRTLSAPAGTRFTRETDARKYPIEFHTNHPDTEPLNYHELISSVSRSRSFVSSQTAKRPEFVTRSNSFTAAGARTSRPLTDLAPGTWEARARLNYGDIIRNHPGRRSVHVSRPSSYNIGIVRPLAVTYPQRPLSRSNSVKKESLQKRGGSVSPSSIPRSKGKSLERRDFTVTRSKSFTEPSSSRSTHRNSPCRSSIGLDYQDSSLQQLLKRPASTVSPPSARVRVTVPSKGKTWAAAKHILSPPKKTPPNSPARKLQKHPASPPDASSRREIPQKHPASPRDASCKREIPQKHPASPPGASRSKREIPQQPRLDNSSLPIGYDTKMVNTKADKNKCSFNVQYGETKLNPYLLAEHRDGNHRYSNVSSIGVSSEHIVIEPLTSSTSSEETLNEDEHAQKVESKPSVGEYKKLSDGSVNDSLTFIGII